MIAFNGEQRSGDDAFICDFDGKTLGAKNVGAVAGE
jgi:hypothetical protein